MSKDRGHWVPPNPIRKSITQSQRPRWKRNKISGNSPPKPKPIEIKQPVVNTQGPRWRGKPAAPVKPIIVKPFHPSLIYRGVVCSMASIPERINGLKKTVASILPQVDHLNVYLNGYQIIPEFLKHEKITVARSQDYGDLGYAGKFFWFEEINGYHATIDDDLRYCDDYIYQLKKKVDQYNRQCVVGCLGGWFTTPFKSYFRSQPGIHTFSVLEQDTFVTRLGTGCLMYRTALKKPKRSDFKNGFMTDVWFCVLAKKRNVPLLVIERNKQLLFPLPEGKIKSLNRLYNGRDTLQTAQIKTLWPWPILTCKGKSYVTSVGRQLGIILRADIGGLAHISREFFDHLKPEKSLVLINVFPGFSDQNRSKEYPNYYKGNGVTFYNGIPSTEFLDKWLDGLNVVLTLETPYNWDLFKLCRTKDIKTVMMVDYEWLKDPMTTKPDILWQPINWYIEELQKEKVPVEMIHMPVNRERFQFKERKTAKTFLCVFGRQHKSSTPNRDGRKQVYEAVKLVKNPNVRFIFRASKPLPPIDDPRVTIDVSTKEDPADNYKIGDMMLLPKTYSGMALAMHEALSCGMPVICMPDIFPQNRFLPKEWLLSPREQVPMKLSRSIYRTVLDPKQIAEMIDYYAMQDISKESIEANTLADSISWKRTLPQFKALLSPEPRAHSIEVFDTQKRKILFVGNFVRGTSGYATEGYLATALESLGHEVTRIHGQKQNNVDLIFKKSEGHNLFMYSPKWPLQEAMNHDGLWLIQKLRQQGITTVSYHQDAHIGLQGRDEKVNLSDPFWACDFVFTADGGKQNEFLQRGINHFFLSPAVPAEGCYKGEFHKEYAADIAFIGTCDGGRHALWSFRKRLLTWLRTTYSDQFKMWGPHSGSRPVQVRNKELNNVIASTKIIIADGRIVDDTNKNPGYYWSNRMFEIPGRGGFMLAPTIQGFEAFMIEGKHYVSYDHQNGEMQDFSKLQTTIDYYLTHDNERETIRKAGYLHVKEHHTYKHRMAFMLSVIDKGGK